MHKLNIAESVRERVETRSGRAHPYSRIEPGSTALLVIDMQNYFVKEGMPGYCDKGGDIAPNINRLAGAVRETGGSVLWIVTEALPEEEGDWPNFHGLGPPVVSEARYRELASGAEGHAPWPEMDRRHDDRTITKTRYSALIPGSSDLEACLGEGAVDTVLITGVATDVCCEATARDAMIRDFHTIVVSDWLAARIDEEHNASLSTIYLYFGDVQASGQVIASLTRGRGPRLGGAVIPSTRRRDRKPGPARYRRQAR